ncbi:hypothetical protein Syun_014687 [Stephania yunnanensis]|uniref:Uncharacterized protein n=1 Tax=Stephania yunnanensis TaxID=152371 RepID=A0AAP0JK04_9MAGN
MESQLQDFAPPNKHPRHEIFIGATVSLKPFSLHGSLLADSPCRRRFVDYTAAHRPLHNRAIS